MWNYSFVLPSLMVLCVFLVYYLRSPRLPVRVNRTFLCVLLLQLALVVTDVLSSFADENYTSFSDATLYVLNMAFFVLFLARIYWFYLFTQDVLRFRRSNAPRLVMMSHGFFAMVELITLSSFVTGAVFYIDQGYHRGPLYNILYIAFFLYISLSLVLAFRYSGRLSRHELLSVVGYNAALFVGNIVRILLPRYLVMNTFCMLAIVIIYLSFENPDLYRSEQGEGFNLRALRDVLEEYSDGKPYRIMGVVLENYVDERGIYGGRQMDRGIAMIAEYLSSEFPNDMLFYVRGGRFVLMGRPDMDWDGMRRRVNARFQQPWKADDVDMFLNVGYVLMESGSEQCAVERVISSLMIAFDRVGRSGSVDDNTIDAQTMKEIDRQVDVKRALEQALEQDAVEVFLQVLVDSHTRRVAGAEALARIWDADGKIISPTTFIPIAEKGGYINLLGEQVFEKTCRFIRENELDKLGLKWINVNLSPIQCMRKDLNGRFMEILTRYGVDPGVIHLEITEESMVDYEILEKQIDALRENGFNFALDDYGSGYSNLTRVKHYPFFNIKLDMELVRDYCRERDKLLPNLINAFKQMGFTITAEGIETEEMAEIMTDVGCDYLQGFLFSKPISMDDFLKKYGRQSA